MKLPGTHAAYAVILSIFGQTARGIHIGLIFVNAITIVLVFLVCTSLFGRLAGIVAAATYGLLSTNPGVLGFAAHATHFVVLFAMAAIWLLLSALETNQTWKFFCAGLLFGISFLMKQPGILFLAWAVVYLLWRRGARPIRWRSLATQLVTLLFGGALPYLVTCLLIWRAGVFQRFWFWTYLYAHEYATSVTLNDAPALLRRTGSGVVHPVMWVWLIALIGLTAFLWDIKARQQAFLAISLLFFSAVAVCPGLYFRPHYFILLLPAISMLVGIAVSSATEKLRNWKHSPLLAAMPVLLFLAACGAALYHHREFLFQVDPIEACEKVYPLNPFPEAVVVADYVRRNTSSGANIAVIGSEPEIYFYSHRLSGTGYIYAYPLLEAQKYALEMQKNMEGEIENSHPEMIVLVNVPRSWVAFANIGSVDNLMHWVNTYVQQNYMIDGVVEIAKYSQYYWGSEAKEHESALPYHILVLKRKGS